MAKTEVDRKHLETLFDAAQQAQNDYWDALNALERGISEQYLTDIEVTGDDIFDMSLDDLLFNLELEKEPVTVGCQCCGCGAPFVQQDIDGGRCTKCGTMI